MSKKTTTTKSLVSGLTRMNMEPHNYDGFAVRRAKNNHRFLRYVGAGVRIYPGQPSSARFAAAQEVATKALGALDDILRDPKSWRKAEEHKHLIKRSVLAIKELGFKIQFSAP